MGWNHLSFFSAIEPLKLENGKAVYPRLYWPCGSVSLTGFKLPSNIKYETRHILKFKCFLSYPAVVFAHSMEANCLVDNKMQVEQPRRGMLQLDQYIEDEWHVRISELGQYLFRKCTVACSATSYHLNQCWHIFFILGPSKISLISVELHSKRFSIKYTFTNAIFYMVTILSRSESVNIGGLFYHRSLQQGKVVSKHSAAEITNWF